MPTETAETTVALIIEAYRQSGMQQEAFGRLLGNIAKDFKAGKVHQPVRPN
jgi:hypothetical protein